MVPVCRPPFDINPHRLQCPCHLPRRRARQRTRDDLGFKSDDRVAVYFGEVRPDKGLDLLLDAAENMHHRGIPTRALVISTIGTHKHGLTAYEREMMARLGAGNREGWATACPR